MVRNMYMLHIQARIVCSADRAPSQRMSSRTTRGPFARVVPFTDQALERSFQCYAASRCLPWDTLLLLTALVANLVHIFIVTESVSFGCAQLQMGEGWDTAGLAFQWFHADGPESALLHIAQPRSDGICIQLNSNDERSCHGSGLQCAVTRCYPCSAPLLTRLSFAIEHQGSLWAAASGHPTAPQVQLLLQQLWLLPALQAVVLLLSAATWLLCSACKGYRAHSPRHQASTQVSTQQQDAGRPHPPAEQQCLPSCLPAARCCLLLLHHAARCMILSYPVLLRQPPPPQLLPHLHVYPASSASGSHIAAVLALFSVISPVSALLNCPCMLLNCTQMLRHCTCVLWHCACLQPAACSLRGLASCPHGVASDSSGAASMVAWILPADITSSQLICRLHDGACCMQHACCTRLAPAVIDTASVLLRRCPAAATPR